jgi:hypothetical protein
VGCSDEDGREARDWFLLKWQGLDNQRRDWFLLKWQVDQSMSLVKQTKKVDHKVHPRSPMSEVQMISESFQ